MKINFAIDMAPTTLKNSFLNFFGNIEFSSLKIVLG